jgi:hypothetical protein
MVRRQAGLSRRRRLARALAWLGAIALALGAALAIFVQTPRFRRYVVSLVNGSLAGSVRGRITLEGLTQLGLSGAKLERIRVDDERGQPLLSLEGVRLRFDPIDLLGPWLPSPSPGLSLDHVRVNRSRVRLATDPQSGELTLVRAFGRATPRPPGAAKPPPLSFTFDAIELGEVDVALALPAVAPRSVRLDHVRARAIVGGEDTEVNVERFGVLVLDGGERWLDGIGTFRLQRKGALSGSFHGFVRGTELDLGAQLDQGELGLRFDVPNAAPERLRELWPGWPLLTPVAARVAARGPLAALAIEGWATRSSSVPRTKPWKPPLSAPLRCSRKVPVPSSQRSPPSSTSTPKRSTFSSVSSPPTIASARTWSSRTLSGATPGRASATSTSPSSIASNVNESGAGFGAPGGRGVALPNARTSVSSPL